jgi:hypothetical protein
MPNKHHYRAIFDLLHLLNHPRYRALKNPQSSSASTQTLQNHHFAILLLILGDDLPAVVFSDDPITTMHDSLSMVLFRFEILVKL